MARGFIDGEYQDGEIRGLTFLAGERGMGKTTEMIRLAKQCTGAEIFFDYTGMHAKLMPEFKVFSHPAPLEEYFRANRGRRVRVCYVPMDDQQEIHLQAVCRIARAFGWMILFIDEIDMCCGTGKRGMTDELYYLVHCGRHCRVSMLATARDPATMPIRFRSQCAAMRIFRTTEDRYVEYFGDKIGKANAAKLPGLKKTYFLHWQAGDIEASPVCGGPRPI